MSFDELIGGAMVQVLGWHLDYAFLNGSGAGQPLGVLNDPALIEVSAETGQAAGTVVYENVLKMFARLHPSCVQNSVWVCNNTTIPQLSTMSVTIGTSGSHIPVMTTDNGEFQILTRPVVFTEKVPTIGTAGDLLLADFSQYSVGMRQDVILEKSIHAGWQADTCKYRTIVRADGMGRWAEPFTPAQRRHTFMVRNARVA